eukprot:g6115.t1
MAIMAISAYVIAAVIAVGRGSVPHTDSHPRCHVDAAGNTLVQYDQSQHTSFTCSHTGGAQCVCDATKLSCRRIVHTNGKIVPLGACTDTSAQCRLEHTAPAVDATLAACAAAELPRTGRTDGTDLPTVELTQADFAKGTYRAIAPGTYRLMEDISFQPNLNPSGEHWPTCETAEKAAAYCRHTGHGGLLAQYHLGFFAAITLEGSDVHLDLNGHTIEQSLLHSLKQRFFAVVETSSSPFIAGQGPGNFGKTTVGCHNCSVYGGKIGRSAHHGIHGVRNQDITIRDMQFQDYEVAAISLNGAQRALIQNVEVAGHSKTVASRATLSAARYAQLFVNSFPAGTSLPTSLVAASKHLQELEDRFVASIVSGTRLSANDEAEKLFGNFVTSDGELIDGNAYGIVIHGKGVLVNEFGETQTPGGFATDAQDVTIRNTTILDVLGRVTEVVSVKMPQDGSASAGKPMVDVAGSLVRIDEQHASPFNQNSQFKVDALHRLRFEYQDFIQGLSAGLAQHAKGTLRIDQALAAAWMSGGDTGVEKQLQAYARVCNGDAMFHAQKGVIGLFVQKTKNVHIDNVRIDRVRNHGPVGSNACGKYRTSQWTGHIGYTGSQAYGAVFTTSRNIRIAGLLVTNVFSQAGEAYGAAFFNHIHGVCSSRLSLDSGTIQTASSNRGPNDPPRVTPLFIGSGVDGISLGGSKHRE